MFSNKKTSALMMTSAMLLAALAGCLESDFEGVEPPIQNPVEPGTNGTDPTGGIENTTDNNTTPLPTNQTDPLGLTLAIGNGEEWTTIIATINITGGAPGQLTILWLVNGVVEPGHALTMVLENLTEGTYVINVTVTDSTNDSVSREIPLSLVTDNSAPTVMLSLVSEAMAGESVAWNIVASDHENDSFTIMIDYGDGGSDSALIEGFHTWSNPGNYTMVVTVQDEHGLSSSAESMITINENMPPSLDVMATPDNGGMAMLLTENNERSGDELSITATSLDPEGRTVVIEVDWGDDSIETLDNGTAATHTYDSAAAMEVVVIAYDTAGFNTTWKMQVEAIDDIEQSMVFTMQETSLPDSDDLEDELDADGDGTVDEAEGAEGEEGFDWEAEFDPDGDGDPNHDDDRDNWTQRDESEVQSIAESNDTSARGGPRNDHGGGDNLMSPGEHVDENETDAEHPAENLTDAKSVMDNMFDEDNENNSDDVLEDSRLDTDHYENDADALPAFVWNETFDADLDENGVNESVCNRVSVLYWLDANMDSNPERAFLLRYKQCDVDIDGDGTTDASVEEAWALNYTDFNSDGDAEILHAMHFLTIDWSNETVDAASGIKVNYSDKHFEIEAVVVEDMNDDGNPELIIMARAQMRAIDYNIDGTEEANWANIAAVKVEDRDDDGNADEFLAMEIEMIKLDLDGDGNANQSMHSIRMIHYYDTDSDGTPNTLVGAEYGGWDFDNNSDGTTDTSYMSWLGVRLDDRNNDGQIDKTSTLQGYNVVRDDDANGVAEQRAHHIAAAVVKDINGDRNPEYVWVLAIADNSVDNDQDGSTDWNNGSFAGATSRDVDSDGNAESFVAMRAYNVNQGEHANGYSSNMNSVWIITTGDTDDDGNMDRVHAVQTFYGAWDNNSDGSPDSYYHHVEGIHAVDDDADGNVDRMVWFESEGAARNDNADSDIELTSGKQTLHSRNFSANGDTESEYFYHINHVRSNVSTTNDTAQYENTTMLVYHTVDDGNRSFSHAVRYIGDSWDYDRDGTKDTEDVHAYADNRS